MRSAVSLHRRRIAPPHAGSTISTQTARPFTATHPGDRRLAGTGKRCPVLRSLTDLAAERRLLRATAEMPATGPFPQAPSPSTRTMFTSQRRRVRARGAVLRRLVESLRRLRIRNHRITMRCGCQSPSSRWSRHHAPGSDPRIHAIAGGASCFSAQALGVGHFAIHEVRRHHWLLDRGWLMARVYCVGAVFATERGKVNVWFDKLSRIILTFCCSEVISAAFSRYSTGGRRPDCVGDRHL
jgi:hypothetical protein